MKTGLIAAGTVMSICLFASVGLSDTKKEGKIDGKKEFEEHCAECHSNGGNMINSQKTLFRQSLQANGVKTAKDIIAKMRKPGPGMTKFDEKAISNQKAKAIGEYILNTFK